MNEGRSARFVLALVLTVAALVPVFSLFSGGYLRGADAYYYALQADWWVRTGQTRIPDPSLVFPLTGFLQKSGLGAENTVRFWVAFTLLLTAAFSLFFVFRSLRNPWLLLAFSAWVLLSPSLLFTLIEFPKMAGLYLAAPWAFWAMARPKAWLWAPLFFLAAVLFHRGAWPLAVLAALGVLAVRQPFKLQRRTLVWLLLELGLAFTAVGIKVFIWADLLRFQGGRYLPGVIALLARATLPIALKLELVLSHLVLGWASFLLWREGKTPGAGIWAPWLLLLPAWIPFGTEEVLGAGERYALLAPFFALLGAVFLLSKTRVSQIPDAKKTGIALGLASLLALVPFRMDFSHPRSLDPDNAQFERITRALEPLGLPMLICRQDLHFYYKFKTGKEAFSYEPEDFWDKTRIWRVVDGIGLDEVLSRLPGGCGFGNKTVVTLPGKGDFLIREDCWDQLRSRLKWEEDSSAYDLAWHSWLNPSQKRPSFLYPKHQTDKQSEFPALEK